METTVEATEGWSTTQLPHLFPTCIDSIFIIVCHQSSWMAQKQHIYFTISTWLMEATRKMSDGERTLPLCSTSPRSPIIFPILSTYMLNTYNSLFIVILFSRKVCCLSLRYPGPCCSLRCLTALFRWRSREDTGPLVAAVQCLYLNRTFSNELVLAGLFCQLQRRCLINVFS